LFGTGGFIFPVIGETDALFFFSRRYFLPLPLHSQIINLNTRFKAGTSKHYWAV